MQKLIWAASDPAKCFFMPTMDCYTFLTIKFKTRDLPLIVELFRGSFTAGNGSVGMMRTS